MARIIIWSGSGGSGVTTLAAATAAASARRGKRTLAYGLHPGLGAAFGIELDGSPVPAGDNLSVMEGHHRREAHDEFRDWMASMLEWRGMHVELADDLAALPGMNHVGRLLELESYIDSKNYDVIVVDAAPLAQFLDLPPALDASARWLARLFAPRQANVFEPFLRMFAGDYASAGEDVLERGQRLLGRLAALRDAFADPTVTSVRLAVRTEAEVAENARRTATTLGLFGYQLDAIAVNHLLGANISDPFFDEAKARQKQSLSDLRSTIHPIPVLEVTLTADPPVGFERFSALAELVYSGRDALAVLQPPSPRGYRRNGTGYELTVPLPFAAREQLDLEESEEGVIVYLDGRRCVLPLPDDTRYYDRASWILSDGVLKVVFER